MPIVETHPGWLMVGVTACLLTSARPANAGSTPPNHGYDFRTITQAGNTPAIVTLERPGFPPFSYEAGGVSYEYRIATTEVSAGEWLEFVRAYAPFVPPTAAGSAGLTGDFFGVNFNGFNGQGLPQYSMGAPGPNVAVDVDWQFAARYCNWLHAGRPSASQATAADFETGAYDMPPVNSQTSPAGHNPGARYWIPTRDEWMKAAYFDPNRFGPGQPGYWQYPITSDTAPVTGLPGEGGQTNAGQFPPGTIRPWGIGMYPDAQSPWGLLDLSGGVSEWLDGRIDPLVHFSIGSTSVLTPAVVDRFGFFYTGTPHTLTGFRIASMVPAPGTLAIALWLCPRREPKRRWGCAP